MSFLTLIFCISILRFPDGTITHLNNISKHVCYWKILPEVQFFYMLKCILSTENLNILLHKGEFKKHTSVKWSKVQWKVGNKMSSISNDSTKRKKGKRNHCLKQLELKLVSHYQDGKMSAKTCIGELLFWRGRFFITFYFNSTGICLCFSRIYCVWRK